MGNFRKAIASISLVAILSTLVVTTTAFAAYSDVSADHYAYNAVTQYEADGVLTPGATLRVDDPVNRAEFAKMLVAVGGFEGDTKCSDSFEDCVAGAWYDMVLGTAFQNNIFRGNDDGEMQPGNNILRADLATVLHRAAGAGSEYMGSDYFPDVPEGAYYDAAVGWAYCNSVVGGYGDGSFGPVKNATRGEGIVMLWRAYSGMTGEVRDECTAGPVDPTDPTEPPAATGGFEVTVSDETPEGATLPSGATSVPIASWDFTAGEDDAELQSLEVHMFGVSSLPSDHQVYLYEGNERLTSGRSVNTTTRVATFNSLNWAIENGETRTLTLRLDVGTVVNTGEMGFEIESASGVMAGGEVEGDFPVKGDTFGTSLTDAGTVTVEKNGTVPNPKVGEDDVTISKFKMTAAGEAAWLEELGLYITGNISADAIANLELYVSGEDDPIATAEGVNSNDVATFVLEEGYEIAKGDNRAFWVQADLNTGRTDDTIKTYIDEKSDIRAIGDIYGFGMTVDIDQTTVGVTNSGYDGTLCTSASGACTYSTVEGGDVTISSNGPVAQDVAIAGDDVSLVDFSFTAVSDITVKNFPIQLTVSEAATAGGLLNATASNLTDIRIVDTDTGETLMGPIDADVLTTTLAGSTAITEGADGAATGADAADAFYLFTDEFDMEAGAELNLALTADVENNTSLNAETIIAALELGGTYPEIRDANNKVLTNSASLVPASPITGKTMTITTPSLTLSLAANPDGENTRVKGEEGVQFVGFSARCSTASDCQLVDVELTGYFDDDYDFASEASPDNWTLTGTGLTNTTTLKSVVGSVWLEDADGNVVAAGESVQTDGTVDFTSIDYPIEGGETIVIYAVGNIASDAFKDSDGEAIAFGIATAGDVTFEDDDGNIRNATGTPNTEATEAAGTDPSVFVAVSEGGSLTIAVDADTTRETILVEQAVDQEVAKFKFTATDEDFVVTKLAVQNRQDGVATADLGEYDDNVQNVKVWYTDSDGVAKSKPGTFTSGNVQFEFINGDGIYVPKDDDATITVTATLSEVEGTADTEKGDAGDFIDFSLALNNFESVAQASGVTYKGDKLDQDTAAASDLDIGSISFTDSGYDTNGVTAVSALGATQTVTIDTGANVFPVGTLLFVDDVVDAAYDSSTESLFVVTSAWSTTTPTVRVLGNDDASLADNLNVYYALPGQGYLTGTNHMHVYETKPTVTLAASSPSGTRNVATTDNAFVFNIAATDTESVKIRAGVELTISDGFDSAGANNAALAADTDAGDQLDGSSVFAALDNYLASDSVSMVSASDLNDYERLNFWIEYTGAALPTFAALKTNVTASATADPSAGGVALSATICGADGASFVSGEWYNCDIDISGVAAASDTFFHVEIDDSTGLTFAADELHLDRVIAYNEKLVVDVQTEADLDDYAANAANAGAPSEVLLKEDGDTRATAYWDTATNGATDTSNGKAVFIPTTEIEVSAGDDKTYTLEVDTQNLLHEDDNSNDPVTFSFDLGTSSGGSVTAGDFWWYDTNATVKWLGKVANTKFSGNTLTY